MQDPERIAHQNMETNEYLINRFNIDISKPSPFRVICDRVEVLPVIFKELGFTSGAEIGVLYGEYSEKLCKALPDTQIYSIDPWRFYPVHNNFRKEWRYEPMYQRVVKFLAPYKNSHIIRKPSVEAAQDFPNDSLDFVFIDGDHRFQAVTNDIAEWTKKVRIGGIIAGHDFVRGASETDYVHILQVVPAWCDAYKIHPWFILEGNYRQGRSWMWVKTRNVPI